MTPDEIMWIFAYEPCDEITRIKIERVMKANCPGDYRVDFNQDKSGFDLVFATPQAETLWQLQWLK